MLQINWEKQLIPLNFLSVEIIISLTYTHKDELPLHQGYKCLLPWALQSHSASQLWSLSQLKQCQHEDLNHWSLTHLLAGDVFPLYNNDPAFLWIFPPSDHTTIKKITKINQNKLWCQIRAWVSCACYRACWARKWATYSHSHRNSCLPSSPENNVELPQSCSSWKSPA